MKKWKKALSMALAAVLAMSLAACGSGSAGSGSGSDGSSTGNAASTAAGEKQIILAAGSPSGGLDPAGVALDFWTEYSKFCISPLISFNEKGEIIYEAAESYSVSEDGLVWTFKLRPDDKWSDGSAVTPADFINTIKRSLDPENSSSIYAENLYVIAGAEAAHKGTGSLEEVQVAAVDDTTLEITLAAPCPYFEKLLALPVFAPSKDGVAVSGDEEWWKTPGTSLGNGAFYLTEFVQDQYYVVSKNPHYYNADQVKLDSVMVKFIDDTQAMISAYKTGEVDVISGLPDYILEQYEGKDDLFIWNMLTTKFILPNLSVEPLDDVRVRKAIALALSRTEICAAIGSDYIPSTSFVPEYMLSNSGSEYFSQEKDPLITENIEEAQALLAEAGYPNGDGFPVLTYNYPSSDKDSLLAQAIQAQLKQNLNITIELNAMESQVCVSERREGNFELTRHSWTADFNDPINYLSLWTAASSMNDSGINNAEYDELIAQSNAALDPAERNEYLHAAEKILVEEEAYVIPINTQIYIGLRNPKITGVTYNDKGESLYRYADLEE